MPKGSVHLYVIWFQIVRIFLGHGAESRLRIADCGMRIKKTEKGDGFFAERIAFMKLTTDG